MYKKKCTLNKSNKIQNKFKYQKFREPVGGELFSDFYYEFYKHLEAEFERLVKYILYKTKL